MGIVFDLWFEETGRMAREAERRYNRFMQDHPYIQKTTDVTEAVIHPNKSVKEELDYLLEPEAEESEEDLDGVFEDHYGENTLEMLEEDQYYDR